MAVKSRYGRFKDGVQISGVDLNVHQKGQVLYVCNSATTAPRGVAGSDQNSGKTPDVPLATLTQALSLSTANRGDKIVLLPGHAETVSAAAGIALSVAGVKIVGVGEGSLRPTITLGTANTATVTVTSANVSIENILFVANFLNIATCLDATTAKDLTIENCEFRDTSSILNFVLAIRTDSTANHADGLTVSNCQMRGLGTAAATSLMSLRANIDRITVQECLVDIQGTTATTGALILATSKALVHARIERNEVASNLTTSAAAQFIVAGSGGSGIVKDNVMQCIAGPTDLLITAGSGLGQFNNLVTGAADASGYLLPAADA